MKKYTFFILFFCFLIPFYYSWSYIVPVIWVFHDYLIAPSEFGQYIVEAREYSEDVIFLKDVIEVGKEPGLFLLSGILTRISDLEPGKTLLLLSILNGILLTFSFYICLSRLTTNRRNVLLGTLIISALLLTSASKMQVSLRQNFSQIFLILLCFYPKTHSSIFSRTLITSIFLSMSFLAHRIGLVFGFCSLFFALFFSLYKKNSFFYKQYLYIFFFTLLLSFPFLFLQLGDFILSFRIEFWIMGDNYFNPNESFFSVQSLTGSSIGWWDLLTNQGVIYTRPIFHYFLQQSFIAIIVIFLLKKSFSSINPYFLFGWMFLCLILYTSFQLPFATRVLITFESFLVIFIFIANNHFKNAYSFVILVLIFLLSFIQSSSRLLRPRIIDAKNDSSIQFIKSNIPTNSFLFGHPWVDDIGNQLWYYTANNIVSAPLYIPVLDSLNGSYQRPISYYTARDFASKMWISLVFDPYVHELFKDKNMYLIIVWSQKWIIKKYSNAHYESPYLELIFESPNTYFSHIFKVKKDLLNYYDSRKYFDNVMSRKW